MSNDRCSLYRDGDVYFLYLLNILSSGAISHFLKVIFLVISNFVPRLFKTFCLVLITRKGRNQQISSFSLILLIMKNSQAAIANLFIVQLQSYLSPMSILS